MTTEIECTINMTKCTLEVKFGSRWQYGELDYYLVRATAFKDKNDFTGYDVTTKIKTDTLERILCDHDERIKDNSDMAYEMNQPYNDDSVL